jgi:hypothetical protein
MHATQPRFRFPTAATGATPTLTGAPRVLPDVLSPKRGSVSSVTAFGESHAVPVNHRHVIHGASSAWGCQTSPKSAKRHVIPGVSMVWGAMDNEALRKTL